MIDFIQVIKDALDEQGKSLKNLFEDGVVSENTFYKYKQRYPSVSTLMKISNYLKVSIDYLLGLVHENKYSHYYLNVSVFYPNLINLLKSRKLSGRQFCKDLNYSRDNLIRWKNGTEPTLRIVLEITNYFNCLVDDLLL